MGINSHYLELFGFQCNFSIRSIKTYDKILFVAYINLQVN
jgi:hypothetical protein